LLYVILRVTQKNAAATERYEWFSIIALHYLYWYFKNLLLRPIWIINAKNIVYHTS